MTNKEAAEILCHAANRRLMVHVNGVPHEMEPDEMDEAFRMAITALERDRWISVEERLPEENGFYLVKVGSSYNPVRVYRYEPDEMFDGNLWRGNDGSYMYKHFVTHWKPLPLPPKEET